MESPIFGEGIHAISGRRAAKSGEVEQMLRRWYNCVLALTNGSVSDLANVKANCSSLLWRNFISCLVTLSSIKSRTLDLAKQVTKSETAVLIILLVLLRMCFLCCLLTLSRLCFKLPLLVSTSLLSLLQKNVTSINLLTS